MSEIVSVIAHVADSVIASVAKQSRKILDCRGSTLAVAGPKTFIIGICGSVAVGKTTLSLNLKTTLEHSPKHPNVEIISTDSFLFPAKILKERGIMDKKGFPESYDLDSLKAFLDAINARAPHLEIPIYSHEIYDIIDKVQIISQPDILIIEGVNILAQIPEYLDFSIYIDAPTALIKTWYIERFKKLLKKAKNEPSYYLYALAQLPEAQAIQRAQVVWETVNEPNLLQNILPFKDRADLILNKNTDHSFFS